MTADISVRVVTGQMLDMPVPPDTLAIWAAENDGTVVPIPIPADGQLKYQAPVSCQVKFLRHIYLSSPTRNDNRADGTRAKNATYSLIDYLDPKATDAFLHITHETYYGAVGDQFGKIVLGFFGDEPDYSENNTTGSPIVPGSAGVPWTPTLLEQFKAQKGYDLAPYLPAWFDGQQTEQSAARLGRLLRRVERHLPRLLLRRAGCVGEGAQRGVSGPSEPRRGDALAGGQRRRLLPRRAICAGAGNRQPEPADPERGASLRRDLGHQQQLPQAGQLRRASLRQAEGVGGRGRRNGRRRQVPDEFSTGARSERAADPGQRAARRRVWRPGIRQPTAGHAADDMVCQPRRLSDGHWPSGGAGRAVPSGQHHLAGRRRRDRGRPQHHEAGLAVVRAPDRLGLFRRAVAEFGGDDRERRLQEPERADLQGDCAAVDDGDYAHRASRACGSLPRRAAR